MTTDLIKRLTEAGEKIRQYAGHADRPLRTIEEIALRSAALHDEAAALLRAQQAKPVAARLLNRINVWREISDETDPLATILNEFERYVHAQSASVQAEPTEAQVEAAYDYLQKHGVSLSTMTGALQAARMPAPVPEWNADMAAAPKDEPLLLYVKPFVWEGGGWTEPLQTTGYWDKIDERWCPTVCTWQGPFLDPIAWKRLAASPRATGETGNGAAKKDGGFGN